MMRLDKLLSHMGFGSRTQVKELIKKGRVHLDGAVCRDAAADTDGHTVSVNGKQLDIRKNDDGSCYVYVNIVPDSGTVELIGG